jgi:hypothetical protein
MEEISHDHYLNYWKEKKYMKLSQSSNINDEVEDINTISSGKVIPSPKRHGKMNQHFLMMETCYSNTKYVIKSDVVNKLSSNYQENVPPKNKICPHSQNLLDPP